MKQKVQIVGVINTTPDSYWDGGNYMTVEAAVEHAEELIQQGADIIEIGGESTGPGSSDVSLSDELERVVPTIKAIKQAYPKMRLSIDTYKSEVASAALEAGVDMVNDVTAGRADAEIFSVVARYGAQLVLMYAKDSSPRTTKKEAVYDDAVKTVNEFLKRRVNIAVRAGVNPKQIIIDPGLGHFISSDARYSFETLARLNEVTKLGFPVLISPSRKSFLAGAEGLPTKDRLPGTIAASVIAVLDGASYIRTHDVADVRRACEVAAAILQAKR